eukprot:6260185-Pyramimonas_sp.AAC.1
MSPATSCGLLGPPGDCWSPPWHPGKNLRPPSLVFNARLRLRPGGIRRPPLLLFVAPGGEAHVGGFLGRLGGVLGRL